MRGGQDMVNINNIGGPLGTSYGRCGGVVRRAQWVYYI